MNQNLRSDESNSVFVADESTVALDDRIRSIQDGVTIAIDRHWGCAREIGVQGASGSDLAVDGLSIVN
jgi:hypothetical protein